MITSSSRKFVRFLLPIVFSILLPLILMLVMLVFLFLMQKVFDYLLSCAVLVFPMNFFNQQATKKGGNNQVAAFLFILPCSYFYPALQLLNIHTVRQSRIYHFLLLCQHFGGVYGCNIIEYIKPSEIA